MRFLDLLVMSVSNLRRRKLRTVLTVLGVVIGTASIVVMVSLGIGLNQATMDLYRSYGSMTEISIYSDTPYGGGDGKTEPNYMTDEVIKQFLSLPHVESASPLLSINVIMKQGIYEGNISMMGVSREYMKSIKIGTGALPDGDSSNLEMIVGNTVAQQFNNAKTGKGYYDTGELPEVDFMNKPMFVIFDTDAYYQSKNPSDASVDQPKKYLVNTAAMVAGGPDDWNQYSYSVYADIDLLKAQLKKVFKNRVIPGQPTNKKGKPYKYFIYSQAIVNVDEMENVTSVQKMISDMGYQASSQMEWMDQSQKQSQMIQMVLGGIGAVSLFVAAIGIANTMMMSIYERTKEIGVIKVLGCDMRVIRNMFLIESGCIGLLGGLVGIALSYSLSFAMNKLLDTTSFLGVASKISVIPMWLALAAIAFAILVGMLAGFFPSLRAMRLSPLAAIRNE